MSMNNHGKLGVIIALSIVMVGATVGIAIPNPVEAAPNHQWCYLTATRVCGENGDTFNGKGECKKAEEAETLPVVESCRKVPLS